MITLMIAVLFPRVITSLLSDEVYMYTEISILSNPSRTFFCLRLTSLDLKICPYHMTFLVKILKKLMRWQKKVRLGKNTIFILYFCMCRC
jgi:hypothetical protein